MAAAQYAEQRALLGAADALIVYTDGVLEAGAPARQLDIPELGTLLTARAGSPPDTLSEAVARIVAEYGEADPRDDFAVLAFGVA